MSRVLTFSQTFPSKHSKEGKQTFFKEKIWASLADEVEGFKIPDHCIDWDWYQYYNAIPKRHTIRAGRRWKAGDYFSPRVWGSDLNPKNGKSGPYQSKQIVIAPDIKLVNVWDIEILFDRFTIQVPVKKDTWYLLSAGEVAQNDGLNVHDFIEWFKLHPKKKKNEPFIGQILCWSKEINYNHKLL